MTRAKPKRRKRKYPTNPKHALQHERPVAAGRTSARGAKT